MKWMWMTTFLLASVCVQAQELNGKITDEKTGEVIPYVNVGVAAKGIGTVSQGDGRFHLNIDSAGTTDTLVVSFIGYTSKKFAISELRQGSGYLSVQLEQQVFDLNEVEVRPVRLIPVVLGTDFDKPYISAGFKSNDLGSEVGMVMKTKKDRKYYLNSTGFWISKCEYDSILFRVNVYDYNKGEVGELLHQLPIYVKATPATKHMQIDLRPYNISVTNDFVITLEWIQELPDPMESFMFCAGFLSEGLVYRKTSQDVFTKFNIAGIGMYCEAEMEKPLK